MDKTVEGVCFLNSRLEIQNFSFRNYYMMLGSWHHYIIPYQNQAPDWQRISGHIRPRLFLRFYPW